MKANELMLGDWVYGLYPNGSIYNRPFRISAVDTYPSNKSPRIVTAGGYGFQEERLAPIPLTPEILEKNGWKHKYYGIYRQTIGETITIDIFPEGCSVEDERGSQCYYRLRYHLPALKYVHELQHALRLCGIEKEIKL